MKAGQDRPYQDGEATPLWSAELATAEHGHLAPAGAAGLLVSTPTSLALFSWAGERRWRVRPGGGVLGRPVVSPNGLILWFEGDELVTRDLDTGKVVHAFAAPSASALALSPWNDSVYCQSTPDGTAVLRCHGLDGEHRWSEGIRAPLPWTPLAWKDCVVVYHGGLLRAVERGGTQRWAADHAGFQPPGAEAGSDELWSGPMPVGPTTLLAGLRRERGTGLYLIRPVTNSVRPYARQLATNSPVLALPGPDDGFRVALPGPQVEVRPMEWEWSVLMLDHQGEQLWQHRLPAPFSRMVAGVNGALVVAGTPTRKHWDEYHYWHDLSTHTYVRSIERDGSELFTWYGPGPLSHLPAVGPEGQICVGSEGKLWVFPPTGRTTS